MQNISGINTSGKQRKVISYYLVWYLWFFSNCMYIFIEAIFPKDTYFQDCHFKDVIASLLPAQIPVKINFSSMTHVNDKNFKALKEFHVSGSLAFKITQSIQIEQLHFQNIFTHFSKRQQFFQNSEKQASGTENGMWIDDIGFVKLHCTAHPFCCWQH